MDSYGPGSADYGLSYEPDPWADPETDRNPDPYSRDWDPHEDHTESMWETAFREGRITREQFQNRRRAGVVPEREEAPDTGPAIRSAVENLRAKLAGSDLTPEQRAIDEQVLASLQETLDKKQDGPDGPPPAGDEA
ncbi:hypothetical protein [Streptomyces sp. LN699]|uniref:hypothetical protein n=1 Tax=Streptomyces sp. LN699 TaxID=3112981 RepID=UPI0037201DFF